MRTKTITVLSLLTLSTSLVLTGCASQTANTTPASSQKPVVSATAGNTPAPTIATPTSTPSATDTPDRVGQLQGYVNSEVTNVQISLTEGNSLKSIATVKKESNGMTITVSVEKDNDNFLVAGKDPQTGYTYQYDSATGEFTNSGTTPTPQTSAAVKPAPTVTPSKAAKPKTVVTKSVTDALAAQKRRADLQNYVNTAVTNTQVSIVEGVPLSDLKSVTKEKNGMTITVSVPSDDSMFIVTGKDPQTGYVYKYNESTGEFTNNGK